MLKIVVQISYNGMTFKMLELSEETEGINFLLFGSLKTFKTPIAIDAFG